MVKDYCLSSDDVRLFQQTIGQIKKMKQDKVYLDKIPPPPRRVSDKIKAHNVEDCAFHFSDEYHPQLDQDPVRYCRQDVASCRLKKLRRGDYEPGAFLDLHGLTQLNAKREIAALITFCLKKQIHCACIIYGHGKNILKTRTPLWLAQHPDILCFHQASKEFGGSAALLALFDIIERNENEKFE